MVSLSIGFSGKMLRLLGMDASGNISSVMAVPLSFDLSEESLFLKEPDGFAGEVSDHINEFTKGHDLTKIRAGVVIDASMAFISVLPIDFSESGAALESHIQWEISNYFPESSKEFSKRYYKLGTALFGDNIFEAMIIAIDRRKIRFIKELCRKSGFLPRNIEIDHFASEKCVTELFGRNVRDSSVYISSCGRKRVDTSYLRGGRLVHYVYDIVTGSNPVKLLYEQVSRLTGKFADENATDLFIYGDSSASAMKNNIGNYLGGIKVTHLDMFNPRSPGGRANPDSSAYVPLVGLALKNLSP